MKKPVNPIDERDERDGIPIYLGDPDLPEDLRRTLYEWAVAEFGEKDGGYESIRNVSKESAKNAIENARIMFATFFRGRSRAIEIFEYLMKIEGDDLADNLENFNNFLADKPIDGYALTKLLRLVVDQETKFRASLSSKIRHLETYELKKQAIDYWHLHIDHKLPNDKAADILVKIVPISHRKLSQYVSEAKRLKNTST